MKTRNTPAEERRAVRDGLSSLARIYAGRDVPRWHLRERLPSSIKGAVINGVLGEMVAGGEIVLLKKRTGNRGAQPVEIRFTRTPAATSIAPLAPVIAVKRVAYKLPRRLPREALTAMRDKIFSQLP